MRVEGLNGISVVEFKGDLDAGAAIELKDILDNLVRMKKKSVIVDMTKASFVGNSIISMLLGTAGCMRKSGAELKMCGVPDLVGHVLEILEVKEHLGVFEDRIGAILSSPVEHRRHLDIQDRRKGADRRKANLPFPGEDRRKRTRRRSPSQDRGISFPALVFA